VVKNDDRAAAWWAKAAAGGNAKARDALLGLAKEGNLVAQFMTANAYHHGEGLPKDDVAAFRWWRKSYDAGYNESLPSLLMCYAYGVGVKADPSEVFALCKLSASRGDVLGQYNLAVCFDRGEGVPEDDVEAERWYKITAERGHSQSQVAYALILDRRGTVPELALALKFFESAASSGNSHAQFMLGGYYAKGNAVAKDPKKSFNYYVSSASQGHVKAMYELGFIYLGTNGVPKDLPKAYAYWKLAGKDVGLLVGQMNQEDMEAGLIHESMLRRRMGPATDSWGRKRELGEY